MDKVDIVLVFLYRYRNFSVRILYSTLKAIDGIEPHAIFFKNCETNIFNPHTKKEEQLFVRTIKELNPKLVGFCVLSPYVLVAKRLTRLVKENSSALVIWGGLHPTIAPESCMGDVDMICIGEGDGAMFDLAVSLREGKSYYDISNLWVKENGAIKKNPMRRLIDNLDSIPFPSYGERNFYFIEHNKIKRDDPLLSDNYFWIQTSRGCSYSCSYCGNSLLQSLFKNLGAYVRRRTVSNVIDEIKKGLTLYRGGINYIFFVDDVFGDEELWLKEFQYIYKKEIGLPFYAQYNPKSIKQSMLSRLVSAGLDATKLGIQTGSDNIRNKIFCRPGSNEEIISSIKEVVKYNVKVEYDLLLDNPYETERSLRETIEFLLRLPKPSIFNLYALKYFPNYPLTRKAISDKYIKSECASIDALTPGVTRNFAYVPKLFPYSKKQMYQNIIWLIAWSNTNHNFIKFSILGNSWISEVSLNYLNYKAIILGKIFGAGGMIYKHRWLVYLLFGFKYMSNGVRYALRGDFGTIYLKIKKCFIANNIMETR